MDITSDNSTQSISDDQELAKALAGIADDPEPTPSNPLQFEETPSPVPTTPPAPIAPPVVAPTPATPATPAGNNLGGDLGSIKSQALNELRPLIDHVDLPAEEKFDTYLLLIRSTDDPSLIAPAHTAAQGITDEKKKAEALLNIIKEIDYLSHQGEKPTA